MSEHHLKTWPEFFDLLASGRKRFEIRRNDRGFAVGDAVVFEEYEPTTKTFTGRAPFRAVIGYVTEFEQKPGFVVFQIEREVFPCPACGYRDHEVCKLLGHTYPLKGAS